MRGGKLQRIHAYVAAVVVAGGCVLAALLATQANTLRDHLTERVLVYVVFVIVTELRPLRVPRGQEEGEVTTSITFGFALLLSEGTTVAVLALAVGSVIADAVSRRAWWKAAFNVSQYTLAMASAGAVIALLADLGPGDRPHFGLADLPPILIAGAVFVVVNIALTGVAVAMAQGLPVLAFFRQDLAFQAGSAAVLVAAAPVVVVVAEHSLALLPLLAVPLAVAYRTAAVSLEKEHQAHHDALTGLANRILLAERAAQALRPRGPADLVALMIIDLDRFKEINDTLGHATGDQLLRQVGARLQAVVGPAATVARLGGDEFGLLIRSTPGSGEVDVLAHWINAVLERPFELADVAMYVAKADTAGFATYEPAHDQHSVERLALVGELREAIANDELVVHFQPKLDLMTGRVAGTEALVRWVHPERGMIPPDEFIPLAERTGLIRPLTMVVLDRALEQCRRWHDAGHPVSVAVNLSARAVHVGQLASDVASALEACGLEASFLTLELTESLIMADEVRSSAVLDELAAMGVRLSIDDFGTGYSSLAYLKRLPVDEIKIDKSFIIDLLEDESDALIARSTIDLGRNLGLRVVAEGVETSEVMVRLQGMGCDVAQGYVLSRPLDAPAILAWLDDFDAAGTGPASAAVDAVRTMGVSLSGAEQALIEGLAPPATG